MANAIVETLYQTDDWQVIQYHFNLIVMRVALNRDINYLLCSFTLLFLPRYCIDFDAYDLNNLSRTKGGGACTAAAFLREFVSKDTPWVHLDIAPGMFEISF